MILIILSVICFFFYHNAKNITVNDTNKYINTILTELNDQVTEKVNNINEVSFDICNDSDIQNLLRSYKDADSVQQLDLEAKIRDIVTNYWKFKPEIYNINIFAPNKKFISDFKNSVYPLELAKNLSWVQQLGDKKGILVDTHTLGLGSNLKNSNVITSLVRIQDEAGKDLGMVSVDLSEDFIYTNLLLDKKASKNSDIFIINKEGNLISDSDKSLLGKPSQYFTYLKKLTYNDSNGYIRATIDKKDVLIIFSGLSGIGWRLVQVIPVSEIYIGLDNIAFMVLLIAFVCILLTLPLTFFIANYISRPITKLAAIMRNAKFKGVKTKVQTGFQNEIGELYENYNYMVDQIDILLDNIQRTHKIQRQTEIKALQAQINPHFLYNTLDSINWMAIEKNALDISKMVTMLSRLFRLILCKEESVCTLKEEIEHARYYVEIQKVRFKDQFQFFLHVQEGLEEYYVPKFIIQPIVENAVVHGFDKMLKGGFIEIAAVRQDKVLTIDIKDNGMGISQEKVTALFRKEGNEKGYGIKNVHERIQYICGDGFGISFLFDVEKGTHVRIRIPLLDNPIDFQDKSKG